MKKFFKFFAVALVAGCMFTACGEKENNGENNGENGGNGGEQIAAGINVQFGSDSWAAASDYQALNYQGAAYVFAGQEEGLGSLPLVNIYATCTEGSYTANFDESTFGYDNDAISTVDYYYEGALTNSDQSAQYGDWWAKTATWKVNAFDATALKITATCDATMFSAMEAYVDQLGLAAAATKTMKVTFGDVVLTPYSK